MKLNWPLLILVGLNVFLRPVSGDDWPQWRGPQRNGLSNETGLLKEWPPEGPKLLWQVRDLDFGYSTPAVADGRLFVLSNRGLENEFVQARDIKDGQQLWSTRLGKVGNPDQHPPYPGARSTPTVDGALLCAISSDGDVACLERASGKFVWKKNLRIDFGGQPHKWAYSESPLIDGNVLICTPGGAQATLVALDKSSGGVLWKSVIPGGESAAYASAIVAEAGGVRQYVQLLEKGVVGVDAKTGKFLWRYDRTSQYPDAANIPTPVFHDGYVYSAGCNNKPAGALIRLRADRGVANADEVYFKEKLPRGIGGMIVVGDHVYGSGTGLICAEFATGDVKWHVRGIGDSSLCFADGRLYLHGENGDMALIEPRPDGYREKGRFTPPNQPDRGRSDAWAYPVVANGRLYIRDLGTLWCYDVKDPASVRK
jgi:outer membrane protein assembly factor BamB